MKLIPRGKSRLMKHGILPFVTSFRHFAQSLADPFRARIASEEDPVETHRVHHRSFFQLCSHHCCQLYGRMASFCSEC